MNTQLLFYTSLFIHYDAASTSTFWSMICFTMTGSRLCSSSRYFCVWCDFFLFSFLFRNIINLVVSQMPFKRYCFAVVRNKLCVFFFLVDSIAPRSLMSSALFFFSSNFDKGQKSITQRFSMRLQFFCSLKQRFFFSLRCMFVYYDDHLQTFETLKVKPIQKYNSIKRRI